MLRRARLTGEQILESLLITGYAGAALFAMVVAITGKAGHMFGPIAEAATPVKPELRPILKQMMLASVDFGSGASLFVIAVIIVYWGRRKNESRQALDHAIQSGPPFLF